MNNDYIWHEGKPLRKGYTTGSCATAAAKACALMLLNKQIIHHISIVTPTGVPLHLDVEQALLEQQQAVAAIRKDGGDDIDVTHGMLIFARVTLNDSGVIDITGGKGIGRVTRKGIPVALGAAAINPVPLKMINDAVREVIGTDRGADIVIFAPEGAQRAKKTYNPRLGIIDGISILGTTGIVMPMSEESLKKSLSLELEMKRLEGKTRMVLVPGNYGAQFVKNQLAIDDQYVVSMSNFVGYMLKEAQRLQFEHVVLVGHFGKLIKVAAGIFHTHSHIADGRMETLIAALALRGAPLTFLQAINQCNTTEEAIALIDLSEFKEVYVDIALKIKQRATTLFQYAETPLQVDAVLMSFDHQVLGSSAPIAHIKDFFKEIAT